MNAVTTLHCEILTFSLPATDATHVCPVYCWSSLPSLHHGHSCYFPPAMSDWSWNWRSHRLPSCFRHSASMFVRPTSRRCWLSDEKSSPVVDLQSFSTTARHSLSRSKTVHLSLLVVDFGTVSLIRRYLCPYFDSVSANEKLKVHLFRPWYLVIIFTDHFRSPSRALGRMCVCVCACTECGE